MLTVAYCRVSTEEQATEGFSIEGQADRLRQYAALHELGNVLVVTDPGRSGKDLNRPGLIQLLGMVDEGHVSNILIWRLDRLSRSLGDLIGLADRFGQANVSLHSFTEKLDLSSATGRMFYNILGSFAQFYREQLAENVRLGMRQAAREGRWTNRPPTGYDLRDGVLLPNEKADLVREIYRLRGAGVSQAEASRRTGIGQSTVLAILRNPVYLGKVKCEDQWIEGLHDPLITEREAQAAHRGRTKGQRRGKDVMSGRVRCGKCGHSMSVMDNGAGWLGYRCRSRGQGCDTPPDSPTRGFSEPLSLVFASSEVTQNSRQPSGRPWNAGRLSARTTAGVRPTGDGRSANSTRIAENCSNSTTQETSVPRDSSRKNSGSASKSRCSAPLGIQRHRRLPGLISSSRCSPCSQASTGIESGMLPRTKSGASSSMSSCPASTFTPTISKSRSEEPQN